MRKLETGESARTALDRFEALFHEQADAVLAYAMRRTDADSAQEVVAETFLVAWRRLDDVPDAPLPWLYGVARRVLANERRASRRTKALRVRLVRERSGGSNDPANEVDERLSALAALRTLPHAEREALELLAWEGLSPAEAAVTLGCSRGAIAVRVHRARRRLRRFVPDLPASIEPGKSGDPSEDRPSGNHRAEAVRVIRPARTKEAP